MQAAAYEWRHGLRSVNTMSSGPNEAIVYVDFDGTVTRSNMVHYLFHIHLEMYRRTGKIRHLYSGALAVLSIPALLYLTWKGGARARDRYFYLKYRGIRRDDVRTCAEVFWRGRGRRYEISEVLERLQQYQARGWPIVVVSGSLRPVIEAWIAVQGLADEILSTDISSDERGVLTGVVAGEPVVESAKREAVERYETAHGLNITRRICLSDSYEDLPLLKLANEPIAVNADRRLRQAAAQANWETMAS